jgi:hypothetical protein
MKRRDPATSANESPVGTKVDVARFGPFRFVVRSAEGVKAPRNRDVASQRAARAIARLRLG